MYRLLSLQMAKNASSKLVKTLKRAVCAMDKWLTMRYFATVPFHQLLRRSNMSQDWTLHYNSRRFCIECSRICRRTYASFSSGLDFFTEEEYTVVFASIGRWLADFHKASRQYAKEFPDELEKIQLWYERHGYLKSPPIPINEHTFGPIHGDFDTDNIHMSK